MKNSITRRGGPRPKACRGTAYVSARLYFGFCMNLIWRLLRILIFSRFATKLGIFDQSKTFFRVWPTDLDPLMHMNNGKYFSLMDLSRLDFMIRSNTLPILKKNKIYPVIASEMMRFRKSLQPFQRFALTSRLLGWDDKFIYLEQFFIYKKEIYALSLVKTRFMRKPKGLVDPAELMELMGIKAPSPALPAWVTDWQAADQAFHDTTIKKARPKR